MSCNVLEWTRSLYEGYPYPPEDPERQEREDLNAPDDVRRVLRGGAFRLNAWCARCAFRSPNVAVIRYVSSGFRVVASPFFSSR